MEELLVSRLAQTDALAKLLTKKGLITREEFTQKILRNGGVSANAGEVIDTEIDISDLIQ